MGKKGNYCAIIAADWIYICPLRQGGLHGPVGKPHHTGTFVHTGDGGGWGLALLLCGTRPHVPLSRGGGVGGGERRLDRVCRSDWDPAHNWPQLQNLPQQRTASVNSEELWPMPGAESADGRRWSHRQFIFRFLFTKPIFHAAFLAGKTVDKICRSISKTSEWNSFKKSEFRCEARFTCRLCIALGRRVLTVVLCGANRKACHKPGQPFPCWMHSHYGYVLPMCIK